MLNALTIDVEDWRHIVQWKLTGRVIPPDPAVVEETHRVLELLAAQDIRATFFVLANVAERYPDLVRRIDAAGHEVASHGWSHKLVYRQSEAEFRTETRRAKETLEAILGKRVLGYRAAEFSITDRSWWALDVLAEEQFTYDSSVFPIKGRRYGVPSAPRGPHVIRTRGGSSLWEVPMTAASWGGRRWPVAGGGYFRITPYSVTRAAIQQVNANGDPAVVYLHPYEFATRRLSIARQRLPLRSRIRLLRYSLFHNLARTAVRARFAQLLHDFQFVPVIELLQPSNGGPWTCPTASVATSTVKP